MYIYQVYHTAVPYRNTWQKKRNGNQDKKTKKTKLTTRNKKNRKNEKKHAHTHIVSHMYWDGSSATAENRTAVGYTKIKTKAELILSLNHPPPPPPPQPYHAGGNVCHTRAVHAACLLLIRYVSKGHNEFTAPSLAYIHP